MEGNSNSWRQIRTKILPLVFLNSLQEREREVCSFFDCLEYNEKAVAPGICKFRPARLDQVVDNINQFCMNNAGTCSSPTWLKPSTSANNIVRTSLSTSSFST